MIIAEAKTEQSLSITDTAGSTVFSGTVNGTRSIMLRPGVYVVNGKKLLVP